MKWYNKVFRNERDGKDTIINFDDLDNDIKVILCCCADGLLSGTMISYDYSDSISIEVLRSHNSYICYVNGVVFSDVPLNLLSDFFFQTYDEQGNFELESDSIVSAKDIDCKKLYHWHFFINEDREVNIDERTIVYYDDHHIRLTYQELELIKNSLSHYEFYVGRETLKDIEYLLSLLSRVLGRGFKSSVVHLNDDSIPS